MGRFWARQIITIFNTAYICLQVKTKLRPDDGIVTQNHPQQKQKKQQKNNKKNKQT